MFKAIQRFFGEGRPGFVQKLNEMVDALNALRQIRGDETFINVLHSAEGGLSVGLNINQVLSRIPKQYFSGLIPVTLSQSGGSDGSDADGAASYTYNATNALTSQSIAGGPFAVTWARAGGHVSVATHGTGFFNSSGTFILWQADETPVDDSCS